MCTLIATSLLVILVKISIAWAIHSSTCGQLPVYNTPHLTHSKLTHRWPWHAAIFHRHIDSEPTYECGGTVISRDWILTAAHCVSIKLRDIAVALGRLNLAADESRTEQFFNVTAIFQHEKYDSTYYENDIALVRLSHTAIFNNFVRAICLWNQNQRDLSYVTNKLGTVVGWGTNERFELSNVLQEAHFKVVPHITCQVTNRDFYGFYLTETNFCAGLRNGTSVCTGDSGGSMTFEEDGSYYIRGIVSSSPSKINHTTQQLDCDTMEYGIYTDVAMYLQWIVDKTGIDNKCQTVIRCVIRSNRWFQTECIVDVHPTERMCKLIFDESSPSTIHSLSIVGKFESIPDMSDPITKFENLETLRLSNIKLKFVERVRLTSFRRVQRLDLSNDEITHLLADTFRDLKELRELHLNNNTIMELPDDILEDLHNLRIIQLDNNQLASLPSGLFRDNRQLQRIHLDGNILKEIQVDLFKGLNKLEYLFLNQTQIENLPPGLFRDNLQLQRIHLDGNILKEIQVDLFKGLNKLEYLFLNQTQIENLPPGLFHDNPQLQIILLNGNLLKELHVDLFKGINKLEKIYLHENLIENLPPDLFRDNQNLKIIQLYINKLASLPPIIFHDNQQLQLIGLNGNLLKELHVDLFKGLNKLENLFLHRNQIENLPQGLFLDNQQLQLIALSENLLKKLHVNLFKGLNKLEKLFLNQNQIEYLPPGLFRDNRQLQLIWLGHNRFKKIVSDFSHLSKLRVLYLEGNVCIDENFVDFDVNFIDFDSSEISEIYNKILTKCSN